MTATAKPRTLKACATGDFYRKKFIPSSELPGNGSRTQASRQTPASQSRTQSQEC